MFRQPPWSLIAVFVAGCKGPGSTLDPAGTGAEQIAILFWGMLAGGSIIWLLMIGLAIYSVRTSFPHRSVRRIRAIIIGGGALAPTVILSGLLVYSLPMIPELLAPAPSGSLKIEVRGKMWWWRVRYPSEDGEAVELANEIRLPVGEPVEFELHSDDVIHAFWIPSLGGKTDMIPGRTNRLTLHPTKAGVFRGACAEYCGAAHALMTFDVIVMERPAFKQWLDEQQLLARMPQKPRAVRGREVFFQSGCHACHTVRGTKAGGTVGPDLTHVGSRRSIAGGALPNDRKHFARWIADPDAIKPGAKMPRFDMLPQADLQAIAAYLESLE